MTPTAYIYILWNTLGPTFSISCNAAVVIKSQNRVWYVSINESRNYDIGNIFFCQGYHGVWGSHTCAEEHRSQASWSESKRSTKVQRFIAHAKALVTSFQEAGNPSDEDSDELVIIQTRDVMTGSVARIISSAHGEGRKQRADFVAHGMHSTAVAIHALIKDSRWTKSTHPAIDTAPQQKQACEQHQERHALTMTTNYTRQSRDTLCARKWLLIYLFIVHSFCKYYYWESVWFFVTDHQSGRTNRWSAW